MYKKSIVITDENKQSNKADNISSNDLIKYLRDKKISKALCVWPSKNETKALQLQDLEKLTEGCGTTESLKTKISNVDVWIIEPKK